MLFWGGEHIIADCSLLYIRFLGTELSRLFFPVQTTAARVRVMFLVDTSDHYIPEDLRRVSAGSRPVHPIHSTYSIYPPHSTPPTYSTSHTSEHYIPADLRRVYAGSHSTTVEFVLGVQRDGRYLG